MPRTAALSEPIWHPATASAGSAIYARQEFVVASQVQDAWLLCAATGPFAVQLNGEHLGFGLGPTCMPAPVWERFELVPLLHEGTHTLILEVLSQTLDGPHQGQPWVRAEGIIQYADGVRVHLGTGPLWTVRAADAWQPCSASPVTWAFLRSPDPGHSRRHGTPQDGTWHTARAVHAPAPRSWNPRSAVEVEVFAQRLISFGEVDTRGPLAFEANPDPLTTAKCVRRESVLHRAHQQALVQTRQEGRGVLLVLDFGRVLPGYPRLRLRGPAGGVVELGFARQEGRLDAAVRYVSENGPQEWTCPQLQTTRFLVARLRNWPEAVEVDCISLVERRAPVPTVNELRSPPDLAALWETGQATLAACRQEIYRLSATTTQPEWLQLGALALNGYALHADYQTMAAMLDGYPPPRMDTEDLVQVLAWVIAVENHFVHSGDHDLLQRLLPQVYQLLRALPECPVAADTANAQPTLPAVAVLALRAAALDAGSRLARAAGQRHTAKLWEQARARVRRTVQRAWVPDRGLFANQPDTEDPVCDQWTNALILQHALARPPQALRIVQQFHTAAVPRTHVALAAFHVVGGLYAAQADAQARKVIDQYWGQRLRRSGSTWGEKWGEHPATATVGPAYHLAAHVLGVQPGAPGYGTLRIQPRPSGLDRAYGKTLTARGKVEVGWRLEADGSRFILDACIPDGGEVHLAAPRLQDKSPTISLNGETVWRNEKVHPNEHVREVHSDAQRVTLVLQRGGEYRLVVE